MKVTSILFVILLLIALWLILDFYFGRRNQISKLTKKEYPYWNSSLDFFAKGPDLFEDLFSELQKAKHHIHILFYIVKDDRISTEFLNLLKQKAREGVEIRLLLDWLGSHLIDKKTIQSLESEGILFSFSQRPKFPFLFYTLQARNHRKITVIDGKIGYIGGFNIGKEYIDLDPVLSPWRDYHLKIEGEGVTGLQKEFLMNWHHDSKEELLDQPSYFPTLPQGPCRHQLIPSKGAFLEDTYTSLIRKAEANITIGTPYFIPSRRLLHELSDALARGVSLTVLIPKTPDHPLVKEASYYFFRKLIRQGAVVYKFKNGFYHAKTLIIDDQVCDIGTTNFDLRSFFLNYEINCYIYDYDFIQKVRQVIQSDIRQSERMTLAELNQFNPIRSFKEWAAHLIILFL
ncbi:cardiolipin synthase [Bacillus sp. DTU_2020_1000418_1_SI_GHA_SEK_038]|uniref:cardiolipin synthase n=1 Tax=Bacillus sp. DTU_2020_1000418_1_SI_GHA_SEK_038 TaxID=3077585 RepID=UPI0028EF54BD|nr:cardiolipin synthase [Bacillus sp. DTU_2020_1000418_1_SI_GHA_SEK_038]WNS75314.1 cardiolipin synthase [Bacillus sp. DTU_2020_1000418_1_SI_GHA_SEK_038]